MSTQLFPLPLFYFFPLVVTHSRLSHSFTGIYTQPKRDLYHQIPKSIKSLFIHQKMTKGVSAERHLRVFAKGQKFRSWGKRNTRSGCSGSDVDAYRAAAILRGPGIPASTLSTMQGLVQCSFDGLFSILPKQGCVRFDLDVSTTKQKLLNRISPSSSRTHIATSSFVCVCIHLFCAHCSLQSTAQMFGLVWFYSYIICEHVCLFLNTYNSTGHGHVTLEGG